MSSDDPFGGLFGDPEELRRRMEEMAEQAESLRHAGPTRSHPHAPDQPPLNVLIGVPVAVLDRVVTTARQVVGRGLLRRVS